MPRIELPEQLRELLRGSDYEGAVIELVSAASVVLSDNTMPFFPGFTDHGVDHVEAVLRTAVRLTPAGVFEQKLLEPIDAAVLICGCILHDLAMHMTAPSFVDLIDTGRFSPRPWFSESKPGRRPDLPWSAQWEAFQLEARHFTKSRLETLLGPGKHAVPQVAYEETLEPDGWRSADLLLIGEFLRRHHARIAHEIAFHGFPGVPTDLFPALAGEIPNLAEAAGAVARSHNEPFRRLLDYLDYLAHGNMQPLGALLSYHIGLLRIADYLQIDHSRAPAVLLHLKAPQSPVSIEEWRKHGAVASISWKNKDTRALYVNVSPKHTLRTHLMLSELFSQMRQELDTTTAILSEQYGDGPLRLTRSRLGSDLNEPSMADRLPYLPIRAALHSDPDLFRLVIRDLYGNEPSVAGRELIQNAVDAVRARRSWESVSGNSIMDEDLRCTTVDVQVTLEGRNDDSYTLRILDGGIGMTAETITDYFLRAGASLSDAALDAEAPLKAGRFGVGLFAAFLLGDEIEVVTRHVGDAKGIAFSARIDEDLVEMRHVDAPIGTEIAIPFLGSRLKTTMPPHLPSAKALFLAITRFYRLATPSLELRYISPAGEATQRGLADVPALDDPAPSHWRDASGSGLDRVLWMLPPELLEVPALNPLDGLVHNGILVAQPRGPEVVPYRWSDPERQEFLEEPPLAVFDRQHKLGLTLQRYALSDSELPFEDALLTSIGNDLVAHALAAGPQTHPLCRGDSTCFYSEAHWLPRVPPLLRSHLTGTLCVLWLPKRRPFVDEPPMDFLGENSPVRWRTDEWRTAHFLESYPFEQRVDHFLSSVNRSAEKLARLLEGRHVATVAQLANRTADRLSPDAKQGTGWQRLPEATTREVRLGNGPTEAVNQLNVAMNSLRDHNAQDVIKGPYAVSTITEFEARPSEDPLTIPWSRLLKGPAPRAVESRAAVVSCIEDPEVLLQIQAWRQIEHDQIEIGNIHPQS